MRKLIAFLIIVMVGTIAIVGFETCSSDSSSTTYDKTSAAKKCTDIFDKATYFTDQDTVVAEDVCTDWMSGYNKAFEDDPDWKCVYDQIGKDQKDIAEFETGSEVMDYIKGVCDDCNADEIETCYSKVTLGSTSSSSSSSSSSSTSTSTSTSTSSSTSSGGTTSCADQTPQCHVLLPKAATDGSDFESIGIIGLAADNKTVGVWFDGDGDGKIDESGFAMDSSITVSSTQLKKDATVIGTVKCKKSSDTKCYSSFIYKDANKLAKYTLEPNTAKDAYKITAEADSDKVSFTGDC